MAHSQKIQRDPLGVARYQIELGVVGLWEVPFRESHLSLQGPVLPFAPDGQAGVEARSALADASINLFMPTHSIDQTLNPPLEQVMSRTAPQSLAMAGPRSVQCAA